MIKLSNVSCGYNGTVVVKDISFAVQDGQRLCIVGPNGCGKSTLLKAIVGLIDSTGQIEIDGVDLSRLKRREIACKMAFMSQISSVYFSYTVFETVMLGRYPKMSRSVFATATQADIDFVDTCIAAVDIAHLKNRAITDLSGGELQRVFLAKAFAQDPDIILLDEPTNHLDLKHQIELMEHLNKWSANGNKIVIAVLHDINLALSFADKILLLSHGEMAAFDTMEAVLSGDSFNEVYGLDVRQYMMDSHSQWTYTSKPKC